MRKKRHNAILNIIYEHEILSQEQLMAHLKNQGFDVTQATVSRDIQDLGLIKKTTADGYTKPHYEKPENPEIIKLKPLFKSSVLSIEGSGQLIVIKTIIGSASPACLIVDKLNLPEIMGTIAGDDTALVILRDAANLTHIISKLSEILNN
ncbi:MAG: arginine repressor [Christensenellaceae bacterium]|jgi:transcriptional regulator of arginine metabolism|nr:arginine repressor [Christensenellaceae bacterium]